MAQQSIGSKEGGGSPPLSSPWGIVFALAVESGGLIDLLRNVRTYSGSFKVKRGIRRQREYLLTTSGAGQKKYLSSVQKMVEQFSPSTVVCPGFCGGLTSALTRYSMFLPLEIMNEQGKILKLSDDFLPPGWQSERMKGIHRGRLLCTSRMIASQEEKKALAEEYEADAVEMESFAAASYLIKSKIPFAFPKIVLDTFNETLPAHLEYLLTRKSESARWGAALGLVFRKPARIKELWKLKQRAWIASEKLAKFILLGDKPER